MPMLVAPCTTGHLPAFVSVFVSMFVSDRVPVFFELFVWNLGRRFLHSQLRSLPNIPQTIGSRARRLKRVLS
jgi:hypothetical protein